MPKHNELEVIRVLSKRGETNSVVQLVRVPNTDEYYVRKIIYGIDQPLYQSIFSREVQALYQLNKCDNIVKIISHRAMISTSKTTGKQQAVGCIILEYIVGETLSETDVSRITTKQKFKMVRQLLNAIEVAHDKKIIHRDINPNNIMIDQNGDLKVIDFGICKIKQMVNSSTVFQMGTNHYSAPEVHVHSQNATERSDLFSIGAVMYYLFTGKQPPLPAQFQETISRALGFDVALRPILFKLVAENPEERYESVADLRLALTSLFERFLETKYTAVLTLDFEKFLKMKTMNLLPKSAQIWDLRTILPRHFFELHINENENVYQFLGTNYTLNCIYNENINIFQVVDIVKVVPLDREILRKRFCEITAKIDFPDPQKVHRVSQNDNLEIKHIVDAHCAAYRSKNNVDNEYREKYGAWRKLLIAVKEGIESSVKRYPYDSYSIDGDVCSLRLGTGVILGDVVFSKESKFVYEKTNRKHKKYLIDIGYYFEDYLNEDRVILKLKFSKMPRNLPAKGTVCLDYRESISNVERQLHALDSIEREDMSSQYSLKQIITGIAQPQTSIFQDKVKYFNKDLDPSQTAAVDKALNSESISIIQGPPGTGKTNVVIEIIRQILRQNEIYPELTLKRILLVSQSHPAVDKMLEDLIAQSEKRPNLIRIGRDEKLNDEVRAEFGINCVKDNWVTSTRTSCQNAAKDICKEMDIDYSEFEEYYTEYEKTLIKQDEQGIINQEIIDAFCAKTSAPVNEKKRKILEIQKQWQDRLHQSEEVELYIIKSSTIIAGTCIGFVSNPVIRNAEFDYLIVDEAAKATYPELAVSLAKAKKIILVGDHKQLPPILGDDLVAASKVAAQQESITEGLFEKLYNMFPETNKHRLTIQYRMHPVIGSMISGVFYENEIQNGVIAEQRSLGISDYDKVAIEWISTSRLPATRRHEQKVGSSGNLTYKNPEEISIIRKKLRELDQNANRSIKVGVITAYRGQKYALREMIGQLKLNHLQVEVDTVDAFQGGQKEIILYSTVRSSDNARQIGFLKSEARLNVSLSRAQALLIIIGDLDFLNNPGIEGNKFPEIIEYIEHMEACRVVEVNVN